MVVTRKKFQVICIVCITFVLYKIQKILIQCDFMAYKVNCQKMNNPSSLQTFIYLFFLFAQNIDQHTPKIQNVRSVTKDCQIDMLSMVKYMFFFFFPSIGLPIHLSSHFLLSFFLFHILRPHQFHLLLLGFFRKKKKLERQGGKKKQKVWGEDVGLAEHKE